MEYTYKSGKLEGTNKSYYKNGYIISEQVYKNDKLGGMWKDYYENGELKAEYLYEDGKLKKEVFCDKKK